MLNLRTVFYGAVCLGLPVYSGSVVFNVDRVVTGASPASAASPWMRATFTDVVGGVHLSMQTVNLTSTEFVSKWGFNLNTAFNPSALAITFLNGAPAAQSLTRSSNCCKLGGSSGGYYDIEFSFPTAGSSTRFTNNHTTNYLFSGISGLSAASFATLGSATRAVSSQTTPWYTVAHVQSIGVNGKLSSWTGAGAMFSVTPNPVPEPQSWTLFGTLSIGLLMAVNRRRKQPKA